jgi:hypothetical protein
MVTDPRPLHPASLIKMDAKETLLLRLLFSILLALVLPTVRASLVEGLLRSLLCGLFLSRCDTSITAATRSGSMHRAVSGGHLIYESAIGNTLAERLQVAREDRDGGTSNHSGDLRHLQFISHRRSWACAFTIGPSSYSGRLLFNIVDLN